MNLDNKEYLRNTKIPPPPPGPPPQMLNTTAHKYHNINTNANINNNTAINNLNKDFVFNPNYLNETKRKEYFDEKARRWQKLNKQRYGIKRKFGIHEIVKAPMPPEHIRKNKRSWRYE